MGYWFKKSCGKSGVTLKLICPAVNTLKMDTFSFAEISEIENPEMSFFLASK